MKVTIQGLSETKSIILYFEFRRYTKPESPLPIYDFSPRTLLGILQDICKSTEFTGTIQISVPHPPFPSIGGSAKRNKVVNKPHRPMVEVTETNYRLYTHLSKTGKEYRFPSTFTIQIIVPYEWNYGLDIAYDIDSLLVGKSNWRKVVVARKYREDLNFDQWRKQGKFEEKGGCMEFQTRSVHPNS